jgi:3-oxo-5-alpha-steroid 4-dehydrogenase 1
LFEVPNLFWAAYFLFYHRDSLTLAFFLFIIHYINRDIIYPLRLKTSTKVPIDIVIPALSFTTANGYLQAQANHNSNGDQIFALQCLGVGLFFLGMWINIKSDSILQKAK